ncbi:Uu.00g081630.m01.CDS01 [Anthostomella pinea]|uniref:Uu.00g081630.m01.CDS01 n=1 Tax=Anthostomella pinea TaxID=933095 RepID=A0AAI8YJG3_9PEZI|nr:Uu.00g081630.m01.CDS01 [Anthostomella pinea]
MVSRSCPRVYGGRLASLYLGLGGQKRSNCEKKIQIRNVRNSPGNKAYYNLYPASTETAACVDHLTQAGAVIVGTTNLGSFTTERRLLGVSTGKYRGTRVAMGGLGEDTHQNILVATFAVTKPTGAQWKLITDQVAGTRSATYEFSANVLEELSIFDIDNNDIRDDRVHSPENERIGVNQSANNADFDKAMNEWMELNGSYDQDDPYLVTIHNVDDEKLERARRAQSDGSDVVCSCTRSRLLRWGSRHDSNGSVTVAGSETSPDEMDVDTSMDSDSPSFCIDSVQRRNWGIIDLEKDSGRVGQTRPWRWPWTEPT